MDVITGTAGGKAAVVSRNSSAGGSVDLKCGNTAWRLIVVEYHGHQTGKRGMQLKQNTLFLSFVMMVVMLPGCALRIGPVTDPIASEEPVVENPLLGQLEFTVLHKADYNLDDSQTTKGFNVIETDVDYRTELARYSVEVPKMIDHAKQRVLLSTMGTQLSGGYVVSVLSAEEYADEVLVTVQLTSPGDQCITTSALTNPYEFVVVDTVKPIRFVETAVTQECEGQ